MGTIYKVVHKTKRGKLVSAWAGSRFRGALSAGMYYTTEEARRPISAHLKRKYVPDEWTTATKKMIKAGYGLCAFHNFVDARNWRNHHLHKVVSEIWEAAGKGEMLVPVAQINLVRFHKEGEIDASAIGVFPNGTLMFHEIKLVERVEK